MLEIKSLVKKYAGSYALDHINLSFDEGKIHVLLGSSGSGKSTLLRAILGLIQCDEGDILFEGHSLLNMDGLASDFRATRMGYVPQDGGLFPHLTVSRNITLVARSQNWSQEKIESRMQELLPLASLDPQLLSRFPNELSGGQKQRASVLRAAFLNPDLLLMDEPLGALDPLVRADLQHELKETFARLKKTVIFVTHDIGEAAYLSDQTVLMHEGRVVQIGTISDLRERPATAFVTRFLNAQRMYEGKP